MGTVFKEGGNFSWRKIMTAGALLSFMVSVLGYLITNNFAELPVSYQAIIAGVFVFYFSKDIVRNTKVITQDNTNETKRKNNK